MKTRVPLLFLALTTTYALRHKQQGAVLSRAQDASASILRSTDTMESIMPWFGAQATKNPKLVTVNTRSRMSILNFTHPMLSQGLPLNTPRNVVVQNVGFGKEWKNFESKVQHAYDYFMKQPDDQLVVFLDDDIMWGGCSLETFRQRYDAIVKASGATVVFGAELGCFDPVRFNCESDYPPVADWAKKMFKLRTWKSTLDKCFETCPHEGDLNGFKQRMATTEICQGFTMKNPDELQNEFACPKGTQHCNGIQQGMPYLNSGLMMGPAGHMRKMFKFVLDLYKRNMVRGPKGTDQGAFHQFYHVSIHGEDKVVNLGKAPDMVKPVATMEFKIAPNGDVKVAKANAVVGNITKLSYVATAPVASGDTLIEIDGIRIHDTKFIASQGFTDSPSDPNTKKILLTKDMKLTFRAETPNDLPKMTLDYNSDLVLQLFKVPVSYNKQIADDIRSGEYCFIHGNGAGKRLLGQIKAELAQNS